VRSVLVPVSHPPSSPLTTPLHQLVPENIQELKVRLAVFVVLLYWATGWICPSPHGRSLTLSQNKEHYILTRTNGNPQVRLIEHTHSQTHTHSLTHSLTHVHTLTHSLTHVHTLTHTHTHSRTHARTHSRTHARTHSRTHARTHAHISLFVFHSLVGGQQ
jgi:hypothetical protein